MKTTDLITLLSPFIIALVTATFPLYQYFHSTRIKNKLQDRSEYFSLIDKLSKGTDNQGNSYKHVHSLALIHELQTFKRFKYSTEIIIISLLEDWVKNWIKNPTPENEKKRKEILETCTILFKKLKLNIPKSWK